MLNYIYNSIEEFNKITKRDYKFIVLDISSITLIPNINKKVYFNSRGINTTPTYSSIDFILKLKNIYRNSIIVVVFDNGQNIQLNTYKSNRNKNQYRNIYLNKNNYNIYLYNVGVINEFIISTFNISSIEEGEADFKIPYIIKKLINKYNINKTTDILTISADSDLITTHIYSDFLLIRYKYNKVVNKKTRYYYYVNKQTLQYVVNELYKTNNVIDILSFLLFKTLTGDKTDNINKIITVKQFDNFMDYLYKNYSNITVDDITTGKIFNIFIDEYLNIKSQTKKQSLINQIKLNYYQVNNLNTNALLEKTKNQIDRFIEIYNEIINKYKHYNTLDIDDDRILNIFMKISLDDEKKDKYLRVIKKLFSKNFLIGG